MIMPGVYTFLRTVIFLNGSSVNGTEVGIATVGYTSNHIKRTSVGMATQGFASAVVICTTATNTFFCGDHAFLHAYK